MDNIFNGLSFKYNQSVIPASYQHREIRIVRPSRFNSNMVGLKAYLDGDKKQKVGKLSNGGTLAFSLDSNSHTLMLDSGIMGPPDFKTSVFIPAGTCNHYYQADLMEYKKSGNYKPMLRPISNECLADGQRPLIAIAETALSAFYDEKVINLMRDNPSAVIVIKLCEASWRIDVHVLNQIVNVVNAYYPRRTGGIINSTLGTVEMKTFETPQSRYDAICRLFHEYLKFMPDYQFVSMVNE